MRGLCGLATLLVVIAAHAGPIYRCQDANGNVVIQDTFCGGHVVGTTDPRPQQPINHNREYLEMLERDREKARYRQQQQFSASDKALQQQRQNAAAEQAARAVADCNNQQRIDELRSGRARYTCDQRTGQKILPPKVHVRGNNNDVNVYFDAAAGRQVEEGERFFADGRWCEVRGGMRYCQ